MRPLDPLLLGSFPAPPTHIPPTPTSPNPPPSRPPSSPLPPLPARVWTQHRANESISSIDVRDILHAASSSDEESGDGSLDDRLVALPPLARNRILSLADPIDPQTMSSPIPRSFTFPAAAEPRRTVFSPSSPPRSPSPDIPAILSATPRPRANSLHQSKNRRASEGLPYVAITTSSPYGVYRHSDAPASDDDDTRSWIDHDEFGRPLPKPKSANDWSAQEERRFAELERQLEGSDSDDDASDSSLDLHTPLPHLMMRHGLLSPQSRLITQPSARDSVVSLASSTTSKSAHPLKDARDTVKRRVRHRDGRLLRGGIGLTTGLGWSDSEDEDAPSALTRRISSLNLTNRSSASSLALSRSTNSLSSAPSRSSSTSDFASLPSRKSSSASKHSSRPLARSYSSTTSLRMSDYTPDVDEFGKIQRSPTTRKPRTPTTTSKLGMRSAGAGPIPEGEESTDENMNMDTFSRFTGRPTMLTASPDMSLAELGGARHNREKSLPPLPRSSVVDTARSRSRTIGPTTRSMGVVRGSTGSGSGSSTGATEGRARSVSGSVSGASEASRGSTSTGSTHGSSSAVRATITKMPSHSHSYAYNPAKSTPDLGTSTSMIRTPRPLRLASPTMTHTSPAHAHAPLLLAQHQRQHDRPPVPVPVPVPPVPALVPGPVPAPAPVHGLSVDPYARTSILDSRGSLPSTPSTPSTPSPVTPGPGMERPRPRVGTGMTYRSTGSGSKMRAPSSFRSSVAHAPAVGMQKPIPL